MMARSHSSEEYAATRSSLYQAAQVQQGEFWNLLVVIAVFLLGLEAALLFQAASVSLSPFEWGCLKSSVIALMLSLVSGLIQRYVIWLKFHSWARGMETNLKDSTRSSHFKNKQRWERFSTAFRRVTLAMFAIGLLAAMILLDGRLF